MSNVSTIISLFEKWGLDEVHEREGKKGPEIWACCPVHGESNPSFSINAETGNWHCFSCKESGKSLNSLYEKVTGEKPDIDIDKITAKTGKDYAKEAIKTIEEHEAVSVIVKSKTCHRWEKYAGRYAQYMLDRGFNREVLHDYGIGYDPKNDRVSIPTFENGECVFTYFRAANNVNARRRYDYPKGVRIADYLWGIDDALENKDEPTILTEGAFDALWLKQNGYKGAVSILSSNLSTRQLAKLKEVESPEVILFFDNDDAGYIATGKIGQMLQDNGFSNVTYVRYINSKSDPNDCTTEEIDQMIEGRKNIYEFLLLHWSE